MQTRVTINRMIAVARERVKDMVRRACTHVDFPVPRSRQREWYAQLEQFPVRKAFATWLETNRQHFRHPPLRIASRFPVYDTYAFQGINPHLCVQLSDCSVEIICRIALADGENIIADFDIDARRLTTGEWICAECDENARIPYIDAVALCAAHSFQPLLDWCNAQFSRNNVLLMSVLYHCTEGLLQRSSFGAEIIPALQAWERFQQDAGHVAVERVVMVE